MRRVLLGACCLLLSGCWSESKFVDEFVDAECTFLMECYDEAILNFLGWDTLEDCIADEGVRVVTEAEGCTYDRKAAKPCVKELEEATCPEDPTDFELPAICEDVFVDCEANSDTSDTGDTGDTGA